MKAQNFSFKERGWQKVDCRAAIVSSCWLAVAIISSVYMWVFGDKIGDAFGIIVPVGLLVMVALIVTVYVVNSGVEKK